MLRHHMLLRVDVVGRECTALCSSVSSADRVLALRSVDDGNASANLPFPTQDVSLVGAARARASDAPCARPPRGRVVFALGRLDLAQVASSTGRVSEEERMCEAGVLGRCLRAWRAPCECVVELDAAESLEIICGAHFARGQYVERPKPARSKNTSHILSCRTNELVLRCRKTWANAVMSSGELAANTNERPSAVHRMQSYSGLDKRK